LVKFFGFTQLNRLPLAQEGWAVFTLYDKDTFGMLSINSKKLGILFMSIEKMVL
jgi:hypothetical protein